MAAVAAVGSPKIDIFRYNPDTARPEPIEDLAKDEVALRTYEAAESVLGHFQKEYGRKSFDAKDGALRIIVGYSPGGKPINNAFWSNSERTIYFGDGDGTMFSPLGTAKDVMAHEFMHGVIETELKLDYQGEQGGIHESFSDIIATGVDGNLQVGEEIFTPGIKGDAIRDLSGLKYTHVKDLPGPDDKYYGEPHLMGEPLSHAAYLASKDIGLDKVRRIWYGAVTDHMKDHSGYEGARQATLSAASALYGDTEVAALRQAWDAVGILGK